MYIKRIRCNGKIILKINSVKLNNSYTLQRGKSFKKQEALQTYESIPFSGFPKMFLPNFKKRQEEKFANAFCTEKGKISAEVCEDIINNHARTVVKAYELLDGISYGKYKVIDTPPELSAKAGYNLKSHFDNKYGNYRIISIGTSPAPVARAMEYLGAEVIYLPVSGLKSLDENVAPVFVRKMNIFEMRNFVILSEYFKSKIKDGDKDKTNILIDFTLSGTSLKKVGEALRKSSKIDGEKFKNCSLIGELERCAEENTSDLYPITKDEIKKIYSDCLSQTNEVISNVPHFFIEDRKNHVDVKEGENMHVYSGVKSNRKVFKEFDNFSTMFGRAYSLCTYNELKKMGLL